MPIVESFTDKNKKRGVVGSYVYFYVLDYNPETTDEQRRAKAKRVTGIVRQGMTFLKLEDSPGALHAKNFIIIEMEDFSHE